MLKKKIFQKGAVVFFVALALTIQTSAQEVLKLEDLMSATYNTGLISSESGGAIAWVENINGVRNIQAAFADDDFKGRRVTNYQEDDGLSISNLSFTYDNSSILFTRGNQANRNGWVANPASFLLDVKNEVYLLDANNNSAVRKIADANSFAVSPVKNDIAYSAGSNIFLKGLNPDDEPQKIASVRSGVSSLMWSPDGNHLVFISNREDHSYVGVLRDVYLDKSYSLSQDNRVVWMQPDVARDMAPVWSADGGKIAFIRTFPDKTKRSFTANRVSDLPWSILVADSRTGIGETIWTADKGVGSSFYGSENRNGSNQLAWGKNDTIVFPWEKDGWLHFYSINVNQKGSPRLLTPGAFEVSDPVLSSNKEYLIFASGQEDIDRQHLWKIKIDGTQKPVRLTPGDGVEYSPVLVGRGPDDTIAYLSADTRNLGSVKVLAGNKTIDVLSSKSAAAFPANKLVMPEQVIFTSTDGLEIHGQLFIPKNLKKNGSHPALIFVHGGSRRQMFLGFHPSDYYSNAYLFNQHMVSQGFVVLSINYRSGIGYGLNFREALNYGAEGGAEFNDVMAAGLLLATKDYVNPDKIAIWGGSYGGYLTAMALSRASDLFAAGVDFHGVLDWNTVIKNFMPSYNPLDDVEFSRKAYLASPSAAVDTWRSPVLFVHGDDDRNVPFSETVDLIYELRKRNVHTELLVFPDEVHGFLRHKNWLEAYKASSCFLLKVLNNK